MAGAITHTVSWTSVEGQFSIISQGDLARLVLPDGQYIELTHTNWRDVHSFLPTAIATTSLSKPSAKSGNALNAGNPWTDENDRALATAWHQGRNLTDLANQFGRTRGAIKSRLERLGLAE